MFLSRLFLKFFYLGPFSIGRYRLFSLFSEETNAKLGELPQPVQMKSGVKLFVRAGDHLSRWFRYFGAYERSTSDLLRKYANPDEVFRDVGANPGFHSLGVAKDIGCPVISFEPSPKTADCFERSIRENGLESTFSAFRVALSSEEGSAYFVEPPRHVGQAALEAPTEGFREGGRFEVKMEALDHFEAFQAHLSSLGKRVGLIKMDIEGAEERALPGMEKLLLEDRPAIVMELYDGNLNGFNSSREKVISYLDSLNYELLHEFEHNGLLVPREKMTGQLAAAA
ncbi:MAG: FkbM family methyltransferase [Verrucomicrobiales bacterium]|nr:FkbM family methyltransferase [Verrucomicrobiales bacterium]